MLQLLPRGMRVASDRLAGNRLGYAFESGGESGMSLAATKLTGDGLSQLGSVHPQSRLPVRYWCIPWWSVLVSLEAMLALEHHRGGESRRHARKQRQRTGSADRRRRSRQQRMPLLKHRVSAEARERRVQRLAFEPDRLSVGAGQTANVEVGDEIEGLSQIRPSDAGEPRAQRGPRG